MVPVYEISDPKNYYNLNIPRYIDSLEEEDLQDIEAHLIGGIPNRDIEDLSAYWNVFSSLKDDLFITSERNGYSFPKVEKSEIKSAIFKNPNFISYSEKVEGKFK